MDKLLDPQALSIFLIFFVPGIIIMYFRSLFLTGRMPPIAEGAVSYVTISLIYHALAYPLATPLYLHPMPSGLHTLLWFAFLFIFPTLAGIFLGQNIKRGWTRRLFGKLGFNTIHPVDCAWDWRFAGCPDCWIMVILKDNTKWAGYLGTGSFMSSTSDERDIYIEQVYSVDDNDVWSPRTSGVWLPHSEIQSIEFWPKT